METMGKKWVFGIGLYLILKGVLNLILGFSVSNIIMLIVGVVALVLMLNRVPYINYIVAVFLAIMFLTHIGANLSNLGSQWIYLLEGLLDLGAAAVLGGCQAGDNSSIWQITAGNRKSQRQNGEYFSWFSSFGSQCLSNFFYRTADGR